MAVVGKERVMRVASLKNSSGSPVQVKLSDGVEVTLPAGTALRNVDVSNVDEIRDRVEVINDLTEVPPSTGKMRLID